MPLKAVLFDMDGVIVDTEPLHRKAYYKTFAEYGINVSEEVYTTFTGAATKKVCQRLVDEFKMNVNPAEIADTKRHFFKHYFDTDPDFTLLPGVLDLIQHYYQNDIKLVLASSAHINTIKWVFEKFDLEKYFVDKISGDSLKESKPNPEIFLLAADLANEKKENCMVIEDSTNGILAAHRAEIFCAAYKSEHSKNQDYALANILVEDYKDLHLENLKDLI